MDQSGNWAPIWSMLAIAYVVLVLLYIVFSWRDSPLEGCRHHHELPEKDGDEDKH
jgi:hypothetical protein